MHGIKHATGNYVVIMDADLSHHVSHRYIYILLQLYELLVYVIVLQTFSLNLYQNLSGWI